MNDEMLRELAFHPELDLIIVNAQNNSSKQIDDINSLLDQGVDLLIVSPNEAKPLTKTIDSIFAMGIPVLLVDRKTESEKFNAFVGGDNLEIGKTAANYLQDMHQEGLNVVELQLGMTMTPAKERSKGFQDQFQNISKHKIVSTIEDKNGIDETKKSFLLELKNHPEINAVYAHNDGLAKSAREWLTEAGIQKEITIVGVDGLMGEGNGIDLVEHNLINASLLYPTGGSEAISIALSILLKLPYEKINKLSTIIINSSNARTINLQMKKIEGLQQSIDNQQSLVDSLKKIFKTQRNYILLLAVSLLAAFILGWFCGSR
ncbi:MAG: substrate-binding domain-containing protein [Saprospiraceae bacterium]|nr:substrate-binding domain-containing protein [Saprospiraceae bacterium]